jgi:tetratricopeptide (TPR) repeat protein
MTHYSDEELILYRLEPGRDPDLATHVAQCGDCRAELEELAWVDTALRDPETWAGAETMMRQSRYAAEMQEMKARTEAEERAAERLLAPLLRSPFQFRLADLAGNRKARTAGVVRRLCAAAHELHEQQPQFSLEVATAACAIARTLEQGPKMSGRYCMALSLRERANALRYLGSFGEALRTLDEAEQFLDSPVDAHDRAVVWYIRAIVLVKMGRLQEASRLAPEAARVFRDHGDTSRELGALLVEPGCLLLQERHAEAASAYEALTAKARAMSNRSILARAAIGAANAYLELSRFEEAERYYLEALVLFDELGLATEKARVEWALALMTVRQGDLDAGAARLDTVRAELLRLGLVNDHALATLEWAAARLAGGRPEGVAAACRQIVVRFESEGMMKNARLALAYVHEGLARGKATPELIRHVRTYLELLPDDPQRQFVPLQ